MSLILHWIVIRKCFNQSLFISITSVDVDNNLTVTPISSLFLNNEQTGFYFEKYPTKLPQNAQASPNICTLVVNSSKWF